MTIVDSNPSVPTDPETGWRTRLLPSTRWVNAQLGVISTGLQMWIEHSASGWNATMLTFINGAILTALVTYINPNGQPS